MCDEDDAGIERGELLLEPFEAVRVEVVGRLVQQEDVRVAGQRPYERRAGQLPARERRERPLEVAVGEAEPPERARHALAPAVPAGVVEPCLCLGIPLERRLPVVAARHRLLERAQLLLGREAGRAGEGVVPQDHVRVARRALIVERQPGTLLEGELPAVEVGLAGQHPQERRLAGAVRPGERDPGATLERERDTVEEERPRELLPQAGGNENGHGLLG